MTIYSRENKRPRLATEFEDQLERQLGFLRRSCDAFDAGNFDEAVRIAVPIRTLVHDTKKSTSLLAHLKIKDHLRFIDTGVYRPLLDEAMQRWLDQIAPGNKVAATSPSDVGLVELRYVAEGRVGWFAPLRLQRFAQGTPPFEATRGHAAFESWWNDPLIESSSNKSFSRSNLVLIMANQDGGAHVDAGIDADYDDFIVDPLIEMEVGTAVEDKTMGGEIPPALHNVAFASVRQIAFELLGTIERHLHIAKNPGVLALSDPFAGIPREHAPQNLVTPLTPIAVTRME